MQSLVMTIISFIIVFGILVFVHEFGHFIVAKKSGIMVREFAIGMGPKIFAHQMNGTTYTIRLLPLGGYVRMAGAYDDESDDLRPGMTIGIVLNQNDEIIRINTSKNKRIMGSIPLTITDADLVKDLFIEGYQNNDESTKKRYVVNHDASIIENNNTEVLIAPEDVQFQNAPIGKRILTNFAGVFNNVLLAIITFSILAFLQGGVSSNSNQVHPIDHPSVAKDAGIKNGDRIIAVNGTKTNDAQSLDAMIQKNPGKKLTLKVERNEQVKQITLTPKTVTQNGKKYGMIGITSMFDTSFSAKLLAGFTQTWQVAKSIFGVLWTMVSGHFSLNNLGGPVAIYASTAQATKYGVNGVVQLLAFLSINLAIMNLLPIPALDGGKILLNIIELIRRKPVSEKVETAITLIGFAIVIVLMVLVTWNDIERYFIR